ncbi:MAG TPA: peptidylprolyl isomerase [Fimbriiglobus sp.]|nr:peptidylprolyl isomerase [Fimbriiglobus sp.]
MTFKLIALCIIGLAAVAVGGARAANPVVVIETSLGNFKVELLEDKAPITVKNFLGYVDDKFYDGTVFHRVIGKENSDRDFMIQGGGYEPGMKEKKTKAAIKNEASNGLQNKRGTLAMARTPAVDSATAQFFVNVADNSFLDHNGPNPEDFGYAVFGKVIEGMDVVDKIKAVKTHTANGHKDVPVEDVVIKSIKRIDKK